MCDFRTSAECRDCHCVSNVSSRFQCLDLVDRVCFGAFCPWGFRLFVMSFKQFLKSFTVLQSNCLAVMETATESKAIAVALSLITVSNLVRGKPSYSTTRCLKIEVPDISATCIYTHKYQ